MTSICITQNVTGGRASWARSSDPQFCHPTLKDLPPPMQTILWALQPLPFCWKLTHLIKHDVNYQHVHVTLCAMTAWSTCDVMSSRHLSYCSHWCSFSSTRHVFSASSCFIRSSSTLVLSLPLLPMLSSECDTPLCTNTCTHVSTATSRLSWVRRVFIQWFSHSRQGDRKDISPTTNTRATYRNNCFLKQVVKPKRTG